MARTDATTGEPIRLVFSGEDESGVWVAEVTTASGLVRCSVMAQPGGYQARAMLIVGPDEAYAVSNGFISDIRGACQQSAWNAANAGWLPKYGDRMVDIRELDREGSFRQGYALGFEAELRRLQGLGNPEPLKGGPFWLGYNFGLLDARDGRANDVEPWVNAQKHLVPFGDEQA